MELYSSSYVPSAEDELTARDGSVHYKTVHAQNSGHKIQVSKSASKGTFEVVAEVELHELSSDVVIVHGQPLVFLKSGIKTSYIIC